MIEAIAAITVLLLIAVFAWGFYLGMDFERFAQMRTNVAEIRWDVCRCGHTREFHEKHWPACKGFEKRD